MQCSHLRLFRCNGRLQLRLLCLQPHALSAPRRSSCKPTWPCWRCKRTALPRLLTHQQLSCHDREQQTVPHLHASQGSLNSLSADAAAAAMRMSSTWGTPACWPGIPPSFCAGRPPLPVQLCTQPADQQYITAGQRGVNYPVLGALHCQPVQLCTRPAHQPQITIEQPRHVASQHAACSFWAQHRPVQAEQTRTQCMSLLLRACSSI